MKAQGLQYYYAVLFGLFYCLQNISAQNWQYFHNPAAMPKTVTGLSLDVGGQLWYCSGSVIGRFNGATWNAYDFTTAGISVPYNQVRTLAGAPDGKIWCGGYGRVLQFDPIGTTWTLHNPANANNTNGFDIKVDHNGKVYWATGSGYYTYDGPAWVWHHFYFSSPMGDHVDESGVRDIILDNGDEPWLITSGSLGIETGIITPPGIIHNSATDTTVFKLFDMGYPDLLTVLATRNGQGNPMICVATTDQNGQRRLRLLSYEFGAWQHLGDSPPTLANVYSIYQDPIGNVWFACNNGLTQPEVLRRYPNGDWAAYPLNNQEVTEIYIIRTAANGDLWIGGKRGSEGVLIKSPVPPVNPNQTAQEPCLPVKAFYANERIGFQGFPTGETVRLSIMDAQGKIAFSGSISGSESEIPFSGRTPGVYWIRFESPETCRIPSLKIFIAP